MALNKVCKESLHTLKGLQLAADAVWGGGTLAGSGTQQALVAGRSKELRHPLRTVLVSLPVTWTPRITAAAWETFPSLGPVGTSSVAWVAHCHHQQGLYRGNQLLQLWQWQGRLAGSEAQPASTATQGTESCIWARPHQVTGHQPVYYSMRWAGN